LVGHYISEELALRFDRIKTHPASYSPGNRMIISCLIQLILLQGLSLSACGSIISPFASLQFASQQLKTVSD
jgi:hypothetical protein